MPGADPWWYGLFESPEFGEKAAALPAVKAAFPTKMEVLAVNEAPPSLQRYWQAGDTDWTAAFGRLFASGAREVYVPQSATPYDVSAALHIPAGMNVTMDQGAIVRAIAPITGPMFDTPVGTRMGRTTWRGGRIDCNNFADHALWVRSFGHYCLEDLDVRTSKSHGVILGDPATTQPSTEAIVRNLYIGQSFDKTIAQPATGSRGLWVSNVTDCEIANVIVVGYDIGIRADQGGHRFLQCHPWGWMGDNGNSRYMPMSICFDDNSKNSLYIGCLADTPTVYGWRLRGTRSATRILGGGVYNPANGLDNVIVGIRVDDQTTPAFTALGMFFNGAPAARIKQALNYAETLTVTTSTGHVYENVIDYKGDGIDLAGRYPLTVEGVEGALLRIVGTYGGTRYAAFCNGISVAGYTGDVSGATWALDSAKGTTRTGRAVTASRPTGLAAGQQGSQYFDTTLNKPIWWDGSQWRDAAGTVV